MAESEKSSDGKKITPGGELGETNDIAALIEGVLSQTQERFQTMSNQILRRIDEVGRRVDDLEKNINDLLTEAGICLPQAPTAAVVASTSKE